MRTQTSTFPARILAAAAFLSLCAIGAAKDGFIQSADQTPAPFKIERATLVSQENDNSRFHLTLHRSSPFAENYAKLRLRLGDSEIRFSSGGREGETNFMIGAVIQGLDLAHRAARHFKIEPVLREHPGHRLLARFQPSKKSFAIGEPVTARLQIHNVGTRNFSFLKGGRQRGQRDNQFAFSCQRETDKMEPDIGSPMNFGGVASFKTIKPGSVESITVDLRKWFAFDQPGSYFLRGSYYMEVSDPERGFTALWEEFVCDEFTVNVR